MRVALVIAPPQSSVDIPLPVVLLRERLVLAGFNVVNLDASARLARQVADAAGIAGEEDEVLLYIAAATRLEEDGTLRVRVARSGEDAVPLASLGEALRARRPRDIFFFVDARHDGLADDVMRAAEHVDAIATALGVRENGHGLLVGAHAEAEGAEEWPLTRFYLSVLEAREKEGQGGDFVASRVYERVRDNASLSSRVPSFALLKGKSDFVLDPATGPAPAPSRRAPPSSMRPPSSEPPRSLRSVALPALDPILLAAAEAREKGEFERALEEYKKALMIVPANDAAGKASIYAYLGEVKRGQGKPREAELNFGKALKEAPGHRRSLEALIALATDAKEHKRVVEHRRALARALDDPKLRAAELLKAARICENELSDKEGAIRALEEAREHAPHHTAILQGLRALYEGTSQWAKVADILGAMCEGPDIAPHARAELRFAQADVTLARLRDDARGCALLERALEDDPAHEKALFALVAVRTRRDEYKELDRALHGMADRLASRGDFDRAADICKRLAVLRRDKMRDGVGAVDAYRAALRCKAGDADARAMLAELLITKGEVEEAVGELEKAARWVPTRAATYKRLFELHTRAGRTDRAWLAAAALTELGAADMDHELAVEQLKELSKARPSSVLDADGWARLAAPGVDPDVGAVLRALLPAAIAMRVEDLRSKKKLVELDPQKRQAPTSTATVVRAFAWASQVLAIDLPDLFVLNDVPGGVAAVQARAPSTALGPSVLSGLTVPALAFVAARHLTYYRPENYALVFYPSIAELSALVLSALRLAMPKMAASKPVIEGAKRLAKELDRAGEGARRALEKAVFVLEERGGKMDLAAYVRGVEKTAHRAGLLLAGDLSVAMAQIKGEERRIAELGEADKRGDLLACCASAAFSELRAKLGVAAQSS